MQSIRPRFLLVSTLAIACSLGATWLLFLYLFAKNLETRLDDELVHLVDQIAANLAFGDDGRLLPDIELSDRRLGQAYGGLYWQIEDGENGDRLRSPSLWDYALPLPDDDHSVGDIHRYHLPGPGTTTVYVQERSREVKKVPPGKCIGGVWQARQPLR